MDSLHESCSFGLYTNNAGAALRGYTSNVHESCLPVLICRHALTLLGAKCSEPLDP